MSNVRRLTTRCSRISSKNPIASVTYMNKSQVLAVFVVFLLAALGFYASTQRSTSQAMRTCERTCTAQGKRFVVAPAGTAGRYVDGTNTRDDAANACTCIQQ